MDEQEQNIKNTQEKFRRRKISLLNKADDLHRFFGADVFFVIRKNGKYYTYISAEKPHWPPTKEQIEQSYPVPEMKTPADFDVIKRDEKANQKNNVFQGHVTLSQILNH